MGVFCSGEKSNDRLRNSGDSADFKRILEEADHFREEADRFRKDADYYRKKYNDYRKYGDKYDAAKLEIKELRSKSEQQQIDAEKLARLKALEVENTEQKDQISK